MTDELIVVNFLLFVAVVVINDVDGDRKAEEMCAETDFSVVSLVPVLVVLVLVGHAESYATSK